MTTTNDQAQGQTESNGIQEMNGLALPRPNGASFAPQTRKREYLSLLSHQELVELLVTVDTDRTARIFPEDLNAAISAKSSERVEQIITAVSPPVTEPDVQPNPPPPILQHDPEPASSVPTSTPPPNPPFPSHQHPHMPPHAPLPVPGAPFIQFLPPHMPHPSFPFPFHQAHGMPSLPPPPPPPPVQLHQGLVPQPPPPPHVQPEGQQHHSPTPPIPPAHDPTSAGSTPAPQPASIESLVISSHPSSSLNNGMPSYEEMICMALADLASPDGSAPKAIFEWMTNRFPLMTNFRPSAHQALQKAFKRGRLQKVGSKYRLNPTWSGGSTSRRTTRRPQAAGGVQPPAIPFSARVPGISGSWPASNPPTLPPPPPPPPQAAFAQPEPIPIPTPPISDAAALLQAIAGINGIIDRSQSEVLQPEGEVDPEVQEREESEVDEASGNANADGVEDGEDDAEGETVEGRSSTEGRDGISPDRHVNASDPSREPPQANGDPEEELRSALFLLVNQLRAAAAASAGA